MSAEQGEGPLREAPIERTLLSWNRAALVVGTNGALLVRIGDIRGSDLIDAVGAAVIAAQPRPVRTIAAFAALVSLIELVVVATSRP
jgi:hypothetical protein